MKIPKTLYVVTTSHPAHPRSKQWRTSRQPMVRFASTSRWQATLCAWWWRWFKGLDTTTWHDTHALTEHGEMYEEISEPTPKRRHAIDLP